MSNKRLIPYVEKQVENSKKFTPSFASMCRERYLKPGVQSYKRIIEDARRQGINEELVSEIERMGMLNGELEMTYEGARALYNGYVGKTEKTNPKVAQIIRSFDPVRDHTIIANIMFCLDPEIRKRVKLDQLYKVVLNVGAGEKKGHNNLSIEKKRKHGGGSSYRMDEVLEHAYAGLPEEVLNAETEDARRLRVILDKRAETDLFPLFRDQGANAFKHLEGIIASTENNNLREAYERTRNLYQAYDSFAVEGINKDFLNPTTGERGTLPSLHQKIALYHLQSERRFGIFDGCGTGKTAIAVIAYSLISEKLKQEGKPKKKMLVVCPNNAKETWKMGLSGDSSQRYLQEPVKTAIVNGGKKDAEFFKELEEADCIVVNEEQLNTRIPSTGEYFYQKLQELCAGGYLVLDEAHHFKNIHDKTPEWTDEKTGKKCGGNPTESFAARELAKRAEFVGLLSGTPIPDSLEDYAVPYSILNPDKCPHPSLFKKKYEENARILYTLFSEKTVRRTSEEINTDLDWIETDVHVKLTDVQKKLYNIILTKSRPDWMIQARKVLLDPRLVDPEILQKAGLLGKVTIKHSGKYKKLEQILTHQNGPVAKGEKFVVFSALFREGVMAGDEARRDNETLKARYAQLGLGQYYDSLGLERTLDVYIGDILSKRYGKKIEIGVIDGTVSDAEKRADTVKRLGTDLAGMVCSADAGSESANYTAANWAIFLDEDYSPTPGEQAARRILRPGQKRKAKLLHLMADSLVKGEKSFEENLSDYVRKKSIFARIASEGCDLSIDERKFLEDSQGNRFGQMIRGGLGGESIQVQGAKIEELSDFLTVSRTQGKSRSRASSGSGETGITEAQKLMSWIGRKPVDCWKDPKFVELYMKVLPYLSVPIVHSAKISDLVRRAQEGQLRFPERVISEGSGPSLLYDAYRALEPLIMGSGYQVPFIVDRDFSFPMLAQGKNPHRVIGDMRGSSSPFPAGVFDMVDNESISLLKNEHEVKQSLLEANRILKPDGIVELIVQNMRFGKDFYSGMEQLGFKVLSEKNEGFALNKAFKQRLREEKDEHFAEAYARKLGRTQLLIAQKKDAPAENVSPSSFWFDRMVGLPNEEESTPAEIISPNNVSDPDAHIQVPRDNEQKTKKQEAEKNGKYTPDIEKAAREIEHNSKGGGSKPKGRRKVRVLPDSIHGLRDKDRGRITGEA